MCKLHFKHWLSLINTALDVESFLVHTLKDAKLSKTAVVEKEAILKTLKNLQEEYTQLRPAGINPTTASEAAVPSATADKKHKSEQNHGKVIVSGCNSVMLRVS